MVAVVTPCLTTTARLREYRRRRRIFSAAALEDALLRPDHHVRAGAGLRGRNFSGQTLAIGTFVAGLGAAFAFFSPVLGLGGHGCDRIGHVRQRAVRQPAQRRGPALGLDLYLMTAANTSGGVVVITYLAAVPGHRAPAGDAGQGVADLPLRAPAVLGTPLALCRRVFLQSNVLAWTPPAA
ncbi:hypothetical protein QJS66_18385 [Kocuria rhizophila]|nr:hypothetical protein QJS66_18385 [Kocuria rhizophila]